MNQRRTSRSVALAMLLAIFTSIFVLPAATFAQEDLTLPGDEEKVTAPTASSDSDEPERLTLWNRVQRGGWAMWPLAALSVAVISLTVYLFMDLTAKNFYPDDLVNNLQSAMDEGDFERAMTTSEASPTCLGQIVHGATGYIADRGYEVLDGDAIYDLMADAGQEFNRKRARTINYLSVISQAAPMLGLLGTVSGMVKAFDALSRKGDQSKMLALNISEALMTTASGLVIALPAIFLYYFFRDRLVELIAGSDRHASRMLTSLRRVVYSASEHHYEHAEGAVEQPEQLPLPPGHEEG
jgi:biopolymer transport protein ExbB